MPTRRDSDTYDFTMSFIAASDRYREPHEEVWRETLSNFLLEEEIDTRKTATSPYSRRGHRVYNTKRHQVMLRDPETYKAIMTYASKLVRAMLGSRDRQYIQARSVGWEDAPQKAPTVSRLMRHAMALPGTFRSLVESVIDMLLFGTSILEVNWLYLEREMPVREVISQDGIETDEFTRMRVPVYDDVKITPVDVMDFYPDPSHYRIEDMGGAAKRFKVNAQRALSMARSGIYSKAAVDRAIANVGKKTHARFSAPDNDNLRKGMDQPQESTPLSDFREMIAYEYWGDVPWVDDEGASRRVITVLNNVVVRDDPWPLADPDLPWKTLIINPSVGRFYGRSPGEAIRYDQAFADALKILLAEAIIRQVHPPIAYDPDADVDLAKLKDWQADALVPARGGPNAVGTIRYDANVPNGFAMLTGLKQSMQEAAGALGGIQGEEGPSRESASVGVARMQFAMDRPELAAMVIENECLPAIGRAILRRYQQFLDTEGLIARIGEQPEPVWIGDIMGDWDVEFIGSRMAMTRQEKLQGYDRLASLSAVIPSLQVQVPWDQLGRDLIGDVLQLPEVAAKMGDPKNMQLNALLMTMMGGGNGAGGNGVPTSSEPPGIQASQAAGALTG